MSSSFIVREHIFDGQHLRQYPGALSTDQEDVLKLHAKSYTPHEVEHGSRSGDLTVISFHANAIPKECYEPLFESLYHNLKKHGLIPGSIWIADSASQGMSATINDERLGNDFHWWDHSRDVLQMVNTFRSHMRRPIVAIGHSAGGTQAVMTSHYHPRLFEAIVMIDPPMTMTVAETVGPMIQYTLKKPKTFPTRQAAEKFVQKDPFFKKWDARVLKNYIDFAFHERPTTLHPDNSMKPRTTVHSEIRGIARPNPANVTPNTNLSDVQRYQYGDVSLQSPLVGPLYNPQTREAYACLKTLRPPALFLLGKGSKVVPSDELKHRTAITGTETGGSGGIQSGNVAEVTIPGGHFLPMTNVDGAAEVAAEWITTQIHAFRAREKKLAAEFERKSKAQRQELDRDTQKILSQWNGQPWHNPSAEPDGGRSKL